MPSHMRDEREELAELGEQEALEDEEERSTVSVVLEWVAVVAAAIIVALLIRTFVAEVYLIPSGSMLETIQEGDRLIGEKITYRTSDPQQGDIVTFIDPDGSGVTLIKRVIATSGQTVDLVDGVVYVDGEALDEPYVGDTETWPLDQKADFIDEDITYPYTVPEGCLWVMGDNRTNSLDSRYFGAVSVDDVTSRAVVIFWPPSDAGAL